MMVKAVAAKLVEMKGHNFSFSEEKKVRIFLIDYWIRASTEVCTCR